VLFDRFGGCSPLIPMSILNSDCKLPLKPDALGSGGFDGFASSKAVASGLLVVGADCFWGLRVDCSAGLVGMVLVER